MPLDPEVQQFLAAQVEAPGPRETGAEEARRQMLESSRTLGPFPELAAIEDRAIPGPAGEIPIRIYRPHPIPGVRPGAVLAYFHGGGWVVGNLDTHDGYCRGLAETSGATIVSVDYRLAPEHAYPAAFEDSYAATAWTATHAASFGGDPRRLAVGGDSAGGNLAAAVCLAARDRQGPAIAFQLLIYPVTDAACDTGSYRENAEGYYLTRDAMRWFWDQYAPTPEQRVQPYASPLGARLDRLPPALVLTAEYDPLRDEGEAYAQRMNQAGSTARLIRYPGMIHGFVRRTKFFSVARAALGDAGQAIREALA